MRVAIVCPKHGFFRMPVCPICENCIPSGITANIYKDHYVELDGKVLRVGSRSDEKYLERDYGIARYEEIKERAVEAKQKVRKPYVLSEETKKLHGYIRSYGVNRNIMEKFIAKS